MCIAKEIIEKTHFYLSSIKSIDDLGGIPSGEITEVVGLSGVGKSNLLHQIASNLAYRYSEIPVLYVDADNTFDPKKIEIFDNLLGGEGEILRRIIVYKPFDFNLFKKYLTENYWGKPLFIIIDSIPNLVFSDTKEKGRRALRLSRIVYNIGIFLNKYLLSAPESIILVSNQVRFSPEIIEKKTIFEKKLNLNPWSLWSRIGYVPALGSVWSNFVDNRLLIHEIRKNLKAIQILFSRHWPEKTLVVEVKDNIIFK